MRKYKGVLLSPTERKAEEHILYKKLAGIPINIILKYATASGIMSSGVPKSLSNGVEIAIPIIPNKSASDKTNIRLVENALFNLSYSFAPYTCD